VSQEKAWVFPRLHDEDAWQQDPLLYDELKNLDPAGAFQTVDLSIHGKQKIVYVNGKKHFTAGDARATGDTRVIVCGPALIYTVKISNTK